MTHVRQQIRERIISNLTGLSTTGSNVFDSQVLAWDQDDLPAIAIYLDDEESDRDSADNLMRVCEAVVVAQVREDTGALATDKLDQIANECEAAIGADTKLNGLALDCYPTGVSKEYDGDGDQVFGAAVLTFAVEYRTSRSDPETAT